MLKSTVLVIFLFLGFSLSFFAAFHHTAYAAGSELGLHAASLEWIDATHIRATYNWNDGNQILDWTPTNGTTLTQNGSEIDIAGGNRVIYGMIWNLPLAVSRVVATENGVIARYSNIYTNLDSSWDGQPWDANPSYGHIWYSSQPVFIVNGATTAYAGPSPLANTWYNYEFQITPTALLASSTIDNVSYSQGGTYTPTTTGRLALGAYGAATQWRTIVIEGEVSPSLIQADSTPPVISTIASSTAATTATITWTTDESSTSTVEYGANTSYGAASSSQSFVTSHSITLTGLTANTLYHFRVSSQDVAGNVATSSDVTFYTAVSGPVTYTIVSSAGSNGTISPLGSTTVNEGGSQEYLITPDAGYDVASLLVDGSSVASSTSYSFTNVTGDHTIAASFSDIVPPVISAVASSTGATTSTITWTTDQASTSTVEYGTDTSYGTVSSSQSLVTSHSITLTGLTANTLYHFRVSSQDAAGHYTSSTDFTFLTADKSMSTVTSQIYPSRLIFDGTYMWGIGIGRSDGPLEKFDPQTEQSLATIFLGHYLSYGAFDGTSLWIPATTASITKINPVTNATIGTVSISGGISGVFYDGASTIWVPGGTDSGGTYLWRVSTTSSQIYATTTLTSWLGADGVAYDGQYIWVNQTINNSVLKVDPATNQVVATVAVGSSPARGISFDGTYIWVANTGSDTVSKINVDTDQVVATVPVGTYPDSIAFDGAFIWVSNRDSNTVSRIDPQRNFIVQTYSVGTAPLGMASDGSYMWVANSGSNTITRIPIVPPDYTPPVFSSIASSTTGNSATITWTTDEYASSTVFYGSTASYGSVSSSQTLVSSHSITIKGLAPSAQYHFKIASQDASGNVASSTDYTFTTIVDVVPPVISDVTSSSVQETIPTAMATIAWSTDENTTSTVEYGLTTGYGGTSSSSVLVMGNRQIVIGGLALDTDYHFRVSSADMSGNRTVSSDYVLHTALPDLTSPVVSNVASSTVQSDLFSSSATVMWTTDESSTSTVEYGMTTGYGNASSSSVLVTSHTIVMDGLDFDTTYHYRISSQDEWGNVTTTRDYVFRTPHANTRTVGGIVSGLSGALLLQNNATDTLTLTQNGSFTFARELAVDSPYAVTILTQPTGFICTVLHGVGLASSNVTNIAISCVSTQNGTVYEIGPGKAYTNVGDFPWSSSLEPGDIVSIYPKNAVTAVTASASATSTVTLTTSAGDIPYGSTIWFSGLTTISPSVTCGTYGSGLYGTATGGSSCSGNVVTLSDPVTVGAGVTVYFTPPYYEKILLTAAGTTSSPITVQGIPDPITGALPVFDPHHATTGPNMAHTGSVAYHDSYGFFVMLKSSDQSSWATYVTLKNLRIQNDRGGAGITSYDGTNAAYTYNAGSGIRFENADHVTVDGLEIVNNDNGLFGAMNPGSFPPFFINNLTVRNSHFWRNGRGESYHQSYLEGNQITYEQNWYDATAEGTSCSQLKDRSSGTVIRNNLFYPSIRELDLINSQNGRSLLVPQTLLTVPTGGFAAGATSLTFDSGDFSGIEPGDVVGGHPTDFNGYSILSLAPGSPTVLTFQGYYYVNHTSAGEHILIQNASGTGCSGLNGDQTILSVDPDNATITIDYDSTGCTYTGGSASAYGGWGYPGSGQLLVMPTVVSVDAASRTMTLDSGLPLGYSAGWDFRVIRRSPNPYFQTFVYGNVFDQDYALYPHAANALVHYGWDTTGGDDSIFDRAGTLYFYNNTAILRGYDGQTVFQAESNADHIRLDNNLFYATGTSYYVVANIAQYSAGATVGVYTGGNNLIVGTSGIGSSSCGGVTATGWQACPPPEYRAFNASIDFSNFSTTTASQAYPNSLPSNRDYHLQEGSSAIGGASVLPAAIASNSLNMNLTPTYEYGGIVRSSLLDIGAFEYSSTALSSQKAITAFSFAGLSPTVIGTVNEGSRTVSLTVPAGTNVTALVPTIVITGASISPNTGVAQNFTSPVTYTVAAADGSTQTYTVTVTISQSSSSGSSSSGGGGSSGPISNPPQPLLATIPLALQLDHVEPLGNGSARIWMNLNADPSTVRGYVLSTNPTLSNANLVTPYQSLVSLVVPTSTTPLTVYGKVYSTSGEASNLLLLSVNLLTGMEMQGFTPSSGTGSSSFLLLPSNLDALLASLGLPRDLMKEDQVLTQVNADAKEFALNLTESQMQTIRNFIVYGISPSTLSLGQGERRALVRDYLQTVHREEIVWEDIERMATGQIPIKRNLEIERATVSMALPVFRKIFKHSPNFENQTENLSWNTLLYRIRFPRDLVKESQGISRYLSLFRKNPKTPFDWSVVRVLGYVK